MFGNAALGSRPRKWIRPAAGAGHTLVAGPHRWSPRPRTQSGGDYNGGQPRSPIQLSRAHVCWFGRPGDLREPLFLLRDTVRRPMPGSRRTSPGRGGRTAGEYGDMDGGDLIEYKSRKALSSNG